MEAVTTLNPELYSSTVMSVAAALSPRGAVAAGEIVEAICSLHPEYAAGRADGLRVPKGSTQRPAEVWIADVRNALLAQERLDGRLAIIGLALLDDSLADALKGSGVLRLITGEARERSRAMFRRLADIVPPDDRGRFAWVEGLLTGEWRTLALDTVLLAAALAEGRGRDRLHDVFSVATIYDRGGASDEWMALVTRELAVVLEKARAHNLVAREAVIDLLVQTPEAVEDTPILHQRAAAAGVSLADLRAMLLDTQPGSAPARAIEAIRLAGYAADTVQNVVDKLGVERDVAALSALVAAERTEPPLSVGLFGDWGSGKSFFMERMRKRVKKLQGQPEFCRQIVQIEFNAWHYLDSNLWASLVTHIFDQLAGHMNAAAVGEQLKAAQGLFSAAQAGVDRAKKDVAAAETALTTAQKQRETQERSFASLADDVGRILVGRPDVQATMENAAARVGVAPAVSSYREFTRSLAELQTLSGRATALVHSVLADPARMSNLPLLGVVLLLPVSLAALTELSNQGFWADMSWVAKGIGSVTTTMLGMVAWMGAQVKTGGKWIDTLHDAHAEVTRVREQKIADSERQQRAELELARERESAAKKRLEEATLQLKRLEQEVADPDPGPRLRRFIEERTASGDYTKHLSVVTLIRKDFEKLSELIERRDPALPIDRIVLYVDDLDRCRPERVIEVLEAVHLLLAFRLFVVVVAVDPRWLARCLELHYPQLLGGRAGDTVDAASPQDYLEKIFQIPFMVRPIDVDGYRELVRSLVPVMAAEPKTKAMEKTVVTESTPAAVAREPVGVKDGTTRLPGSNVTNVQHAVTPTQAPAVHADAHHDEDALAIDPRRLELNEWERKGLEALAPLFTTPRSVKRFVNIYRLLRVSLWQAEVAAFDGQPGKPGDHGTVLLLLALVTNYPRLAGHLLQHTASAEVMTWADLVKRVSDASATAPDGLAPDDLHDWKGLCRRLSKLEAAHLPGPLATSRTWTPRVVRYSFFVDQRN